MVAVLPGGEFDADAFKLWHCLAFGRSLKKASPPVPDSAGDPSPWHSVNFGDGLELRPAGKTQRKKLRVRFCRKVWACI